LDHTVLQIVGVASFILSLFAALYFASGAFFKSTSKVVFAALIIFIISVIDFNLGTIGDSANTGFWLAMFVAVIWKIIWLLSKINFDGFKSPTPSPVLPTPPPVSPNRKSIKPKPEVPSAYSVPPLRATKEKVANPVKKVKDKPDDKSGNTNLLILLFITFSALIGMAMPAYAVEKDREIRVMAPFKDLAKVLPSGDRVVIIPESDYRYLKDIEIQKVPVIKAPYSFRFETAKYIGRLEKTGARLRAIFKINLLNEGWKTIKLLSSEAVPTSAVIDDTPLALTLINSNPSFYGFMTNATGTVNVEVSFFVPASLSEYRHTSKFMLRTVPVCLTTLEIIRSLSRV